MANKHSEDIVFCLVKSFRLILIVCNLNNNMPRSLTECLRLQQLLIDGFKNANVFLMKALFLLFLETQTSQKMAAQTDLLMPRKHRSA